MCHEIFFFCPEHVLEDVNKADSLKGVDSILVYVSECLPAVCLCIMYVPDALGGQKAALDALGLQLHVIMSCHVCAENRTQVLCKGS